MPLLLFAASDHVILPALDFDAGLPGRGARMSSLHMQR